MKKQNGTQTFLHNHIILVAFLIGIGALFSRFVFSKKTFAPTHEQTRDRSLPTTQPKNGEIQPATACLKMSGKALQTCCQDWAVANKLNTIDCVGSWQIENGTCAYSCTTSEEN